jgi:hypothetical protein
VNKYNCRYRHGPLLNIGDKWEMDIEASSPKEAYESFIKQVGIFQKEVIVDDDELFINSEVFDDHVDKELQKKIIEQEKLQLEEKKAEEDKKKLEEKKAEEDKKKIEERKAEADKKKLEQNKNLSTDELLSKIIKNQNKQTEALYTIRWAICSLLALLLYQWIKLIMKW